MWKEIITLPFIYAYILIVFRIFRGWLGAKFYIMNFVLFLEWELIQIGGIKIVYVLLFD